MERELASESPVTALQLSRRAHEFVAHELLVLILSGRFRAGDRLPPERQLATGFGVSRPTIRQALRVLAANGLVESRIGSGTFVVGPVRDESAGEGESLRDVMESRLVFEVGAVRLAARRAPTARRPAFSPDRAMFTTTANRVLPTTVTGSWPRPTWFDSGLWGRTLSDALLDISYREQLLDAVSVVVGEQERAGLDIVANGDYHLDPDLAGLSWMRYPLERIDRLDQRQAVPATDPAEHPPGTLLAEVASAWRVPAVTGRIGSGSRLELDKRWRIAQSRSNRPVRFGTVSAQMLASVLDLPTDLYTRDKRELMWDLATTMNTELRKLVAAGCRSIQIEEPLLHFVAASTP